MFNCLLYFTSNFCINTFAALFGNLKEQHSAAGDGGDFLLARTSGHRRECDPRKLIGKSPDLPFGLK